MGRFGAGMGGSGGSVAPGVKGILEQAAPFLLNNLPGLSPPQEQYQPISPPFVPEQQNNGLLPPLMRTMELRGPFNRGGYYQ
jgi:hypothetical protein